MYSGGGVTAVPEKDRDKEKIMVLLSSKKRFDN